jgi:hypothetical protein
VPVIFAHLLLAVGGLTVWTAFLLLQQKRLAWTAVGILVAVAVLGARATRSSVVPPIMLALLQHPDSPG